ncbi:peptidase dimerization domain-containing protein [Brevibacillus ruminantium]|uniref:peptidase dimerization domain-containing protein n=1 Tax=Brevibacillus ruminantium TaxID=2950604 RepID=UPI002AC826C8|nr:peptidase dimerization domain-containing protein [Brevibacillus ruminantium]
MGRAIAKIADLQTPINPKTTFTVGTVCGGTSVNTIAADAQILIDVRSNSPEELQILGEKVTATLYEAAKEEGARWGSEAIEVHIDVVGHRPAGYQPADALIVQASLASAAALGFVPQLSQASSTDANVPISLGIPAVTLGGGGSNGGAHTLNEWFDPTDAYYGVQRIFLTTLALVGMDNVVEPLLSKR